MARQPPLADAALAAAWMDRAVRSGPIAMEPSVHAAEKALSLYESCHNRLKETLPSSSEEVHLKENNGLVMNLELRIAQTLRFLAFLHASHAFVEVAIKYHDMAVGLLVGVFEQNQQTENRNDGSGSGSGQLIASRNPSQSGDSEHSDGRDAVRTHPDRGESHSSSNRDGRDPEGENAGSLEQDSNDCDIGSEGRVLATVSLDPSMHPFLNNRLSFADDAELTVAFVQPSENERVRAISASLNALGELHSKAGDDKQAMESYREALEILRAACEEEDEVEEESDVFDEKNDDNSKEKQPGNRVGLDAAGIDCTTKENTVQDILKEELANTLMNVGNFHLRRDELDAALNAYSTVWALHTDNMTSVNTAPSTPLSHESFAVDSRGAYSLPTNTSVNNFRTPQTPMSQKSLSTPTSYQTPNVQDMKRCSPGALMALNNLGVVHERKGEFQEALACQYYVHRVRVELLGEEHTETIQTLVNIANCCQRLRDWNLAVNAYNEAAAGYRKIIRSRESAAGSGVASNLEGYMKICRSLAGTLRNWGTCLARQHNISVALDKFHEAIKTEEKIANAAVESSSEELVYNAKLSKAQLLGIVGCLHIDHRVSHLRCADQAKLAFREAIEVYDELGFEKDHPALQWMRKSLSIADADSAPGPTEIPPPPPPPYPPLQQSSAPTNTGACSTPIQRPARVERHDTGETGHATTGTGQTGKTSDEVDLDDIDSFELDGVLATDENDVFDPDDDDIFLGVNSTDELDQALATDDECDGNHDEVNDIDGLDITQTIPKSSSELIEEEVGNVQQPAHAEQDDSEVISNLQETAGSHGADSVEAAAAHVALAEHFSQKGDRATATVHYTEAHAIYQSQLGESVETAMVLKKLGDLNYQEGLLDTSKELYMEALGTELSVSGEYSPQTLNAAGVVCLHQEDFRSAMEFHRQALQIQKKCALEGTSKYEMYATLVFIGNVYYSERNNLTNIRSNGVDYGEFIQSGFLGWIANAHDMRGEYLKAIRFYEESLQMSLGRTGKERNRETALTLNRLGSLTRELCRYDEALDYHQRALNIQKTSSSSAKPSTAETCVLMAMVRAKMCDYKLALDLYEDSLVVLRGKLGNEHLSVSKTLSQMGCVRFKLSNFNEAMEALTEAENYQLSTVGDLNRETLETQTLIGRILLATGQFEDAMMTLRDVLGRQRRLFGQSHPAIADTLSYIGHCYLDQESHTQARAMFVECYNMRKEFFTVDQVHIAESMVDIIRARPGQPERALALYLNAMEVYKEYLADDHVLIARLMLYKGDSHAEMLDFSSSIENYESAEKIFLDRLGSLSTESALVSVSIGKVLLRKCEYEGAKKRFGDALEVYKKILPGGHPKIAQAMSLLNRVGEEEALCV